MLWLTVLYGCSAMGFGCNLLVDNNTVRFQNLVFNVAKLNIHQLPHEAMDEIIIGCVQSVRPAQLLQPLTHFLVSPSRLDRFLHDMALCLSIVYNNWRLHWVCTRTLPDNLEKSPRMVSNIWNHKRSGKHKHDQIFEATRSVTALLGNNPIQSHGHCALC